MAKTILIQPVISEKAETLAETSGKYTFIVDRTANKIEIRKAVEKMYNVSVNGVNTMVLPGKIKKRYTRSGVQEGHVSSVKKAVVTLAEGEEIDFFGDV
jgi:large subunit ribosomal protein L23